MKMFSKKGTKKVKKNSIFAKKRDKIVTYYLIVILKKGQKKVKKR
jgi:hypothetical protein